MQVIAQLAAALDVSVDDLLQEVGIPTARTAAPTNEVDELWPLLHSPARETLVKVGHRVVRDAARHGASGFLKALCSLFRYLHAEHACHTRKGHSSWVLLDQLTAGNRNLVPFRSEQRHGWILLRLLSRSETMATMVSIAYQVVEHSLERGIEREGEHMRSRLAFLHIDGARERADLRVSTSTTNDVHHFIVNGGVRYSEIHEAPQAEWATPNQSPA